MGDECRDSGPSSAGSHIAFAGGLALDLHAVEKLYECVLAARSDAVTAALAKAVDSLVSGSYSWGAQSGQEASRTWQNVQRLGQSFSTGITNEGGLPVQDLCMTIQLQRHIEVTALTHVDANDIMLAAFVTAELGQVNTLAASL